MKKLLFIFSFFLIIHTMNGQAALNNRVTVRNQGNVDNYTGVKQVLVSLPADSVDHIFNGSTLVFDTVHGLFRLAVPSTSGSESGGGFFIGSTATGGTIQDANGTDFQLINYQGLYFTSTSETSTVEIRSALDFAIRSAIGSYKFITPPMPDTGTVDRLIGYNNASGQWFAVSQNVPDTWVAKMSQSGSGEPSFIVLDPFTGGTITATRDDTGIYTFVIPGFDYATEQNKLVAFVSPGVTSAPVSQFDVVDIFGAGDDGMFLQTFSPLGVAADIDGTYTIEIRLYH